MSERSEGSGDDPAVSRRWLIRLLVGLGIGVPVAVEGATLLGLVRDRLFGGNDEAATTTTTTRRGVGIGDELLPETAPTERLTTATVDASGDDWELVLSVTVENTGQTGYELALGAVTTGGGDTVDGEATTGRIDPGDSAFVTGSWTLPAGSTPETVAVTATTYGEETDRLRRQVRLNRIPVER